MYGSRYPRTQPSAGVSSIAAVAGLIAAAAVLFALGIIFAIPAMLLFNSIVLERLPDYVAPLSIWDAWGIGILCALWIKPWGWMSNKED